MNPAPLPQPTAQTCPRCGAAIEGNVAFCPRCGAALASGRKGGAWNVLLQIVLGIVALVAGSFGVCFALLGGMGVAGSTWRDWLPVVGAGVVGLAIAAACVRGINRLNKKPQ